MNELSNSEVERNVGLYAAARPKFESYCADIHRTLREILYAHGIKYHSIEKRAKEIDSFKKKIASTDSNGKPKYQKPMEEVTDLSAVRVILFTTKLVEQACRIIEDNFHVRWRKDIGEERADTKDFGYQSVHYLVYHSEQRLNLPDYQQFKDMICEIQVRTILQHAWAEIEHDIQYKSESEIPKEIRRKFRALAGLLEIADREFQSIQDADAELKAAIENSAATELTQSAMRESHAHPSPISSEDGASVEPAGKDGIINVRNLILEKRYEDALQAYTEYIRVMPTAHTLYLGRAKVRFLLGDRSSALMDLEEAAKLSPDDPAVSIVRSQVESGVVMHPAGQESGDAIRAGNAALAEGQGESAFLSFSDAQEKGYNFAFSTFNMAMACTLAGDTKGARSYLNKLKRFPNTPMEINILALSCLIDIIAEEAVGDKEKELERLVEEKTDYDFRLSPLSLLKRGIEKADPGGVAGFNRIFSILTRGSSES